MGYEILITEIPNEPDTPDYQVVLALVNIKRGERKVFPLVFQFADTLVQARDRALKLRQRSSRFAEAPISCSVLESPESASESL